MREEEPDVIGMLIRHELVIKELYEIFATMYKNHESFWQNLAADEQKHADWLAELRSDPITDKWFKYSSQLKPQAIKTSIGFVEQQIAKAKEGNLSLLQALSIARDLESALLERQFSKLKDSVPKEIRPIIMSLANETERHRKIVIELFVYEKRKIS
ncbi:MAG: hypothetical protein SVO01_08495 [Thermotogota bacterium]|nr:hypothetical protein [Thermotogota bacterium]